MTLTVSDAWGKAGGHPPGDDVSRAGGQLRADDHVPPAHLHRTFVLGEQHRDHRPQGIRGYLWNWGDGTTESTGASPSAHVYAAAGTHAITLIVTDNGGRTTTVTSDMTVT